MKTKNKDDIEKEYTELLELNKNAGIVDLMKVYGNLKQYIEGSEAYLKEMNPKFSLSITDSSD
jgi:hypothetical protein